MMKVLMAVHRCRQVLWNDVKNVTPQGKTSTKTVVLVSAILLGSFTVIVVVSTIELLDYTNRNALILF